jgi:hypothetical protein
MTISSTKRNWVDPPVRFNKQMKRMAAVDHDGDFVEASFISTSTTTTARSKKSRRVSDASTGTSKNDLMKDDCSCHVEQWAPALAEFQEEQQSPPSQRIQPPKRISFSEKVSTISPSPEVDYSGRTTTTTHSRIEPPDNDALFYTEQELLMFAWQEQVQKHAMILTTMVYQEQRRRITYRIPLLGSSSVLELYHKVVSKATASEPPAFFREDNRCRRKSLVDDDATKGGLDAATTTAPWIKHRLDNHRNTIVARQA